MKVLLIMLMTRKYMRMITATTKIMATSTKTQSHTIKEIRNITITVKAKSLASYRQVTWWFFCSLHWWLFPCRSHLYESDELWLGAWQSDSQKQLICVAPRIFLHLMEFFLCSFLPCLFLLVKLEWAYM